jgi:hypothetical protein
MASLPTATVTLVIGWLNLGFSGKKDPIIFQITDKKPLHNKFSE